MSRLNLALIFVAFSVLSVQIISATTLSPSASPTQTSTRYPTTSPRASTTSPRYPTTSPRYPTTSPRYTTTSPRYPTTAPKNYINCYDCDSRINSCYDPFSRFGVKVVQCPIGYCCRKNIYVEKNTNLLVTQRSCSYDCSTSHKQTDKNGRVINYIGSCTRDLCNSALTNFAGYAKLMAVFSLFFQILVQRI